MNIDTLATIAGAVSDPTSDSLLAGRQRLDGAVFGAQARVTAVRRSRRPRRWGITALAGAAAIAVAALAVPLVIATPASAEGVLLAAADAAGLQVDETAGAAYWYVRSEIEYADSDPAQREIWQGRTAEGILRDEGLGEGAPDDGADDPAQVRTEGLGQPAVFAVGGVALSWQDLDELPTDATQLEARLRELVAGHPSGEENELWESVTGLLRESPASPALRRALWQVAANMPDVELVGTMTDAVGRQGTAIERDQLDQGWFRVVYILDPSDGSLLEWRDVDADGVVVFRSTQLEQGPSETAPDAQPPVCGPGSVDGHSC